MTLPSPRAALLGVLLVIGLVVLVERLVVTDREAIENALEEALDAIQDREVRRLRPLLSDAFTWNRLGPDETVQSLERLLAGQAASIGAKWGAIEPEGDRCVVEVSVTVLPYQGLFPVRVVFVREEAGWKVREVRNA